MILSTCPFCHQSVPSSELERHANNHFEDEDFARDFELAQEIAIAPPSPPDISMDKKMLSESNFRRIPESSSSRCEGRLCGGGRSDIDENVCCLVSLQLRETYFEVKNGLIGLLRNCLERESENSISILSGYVDHFRSIESEDVGWGCGWRNIQMLSSHLLMQRQEVREVLFGGCGFVPDIASLQRWLEIAWESGFDTLGSNDFDRNIYGKRNWIGTTECAALFRSFGLRARIVDFCSKQSTSVTSVTSSSSEAGENGLNGSKRKSTQVIGPMDSFLCGGGNCISQAGTSGKGKDRCSTNNPWKIKGHQLLVDWVWTYFSDNKLSRSVHNRVIVSEKAPLYFQHDGHSRTIVGIQVKHQCNGVQQYTLLILDPAHTTEVLARSLSENIGWQKLIKRGVHTLKKLEYQLCYIDPGIAAGEEMEKLKTLDSTYFEF